MSKMKTASCEICDSKFKFYPSGRLHPRFCSYKCMGISQRGKPGHSKLDLPINDIVTAYSEGETIYEIASRYNTSAPTIASRLEKAGIKRRKQTDKNFRHPNAVKKAKENHPRGKNHPQYKDLPMDKIIQLYKAGESTLTLAHKYDVAPITIGRKLRKYGIKIRRAGFGHWCKCSDGHLVQSKWEQMVDEWLFEHNIEHIIHPRCPWYTKQLHYKADFLVCNTYIEVWGVTGNTKYDQRRLTKKAKYKEYDVHLIEIFPHHLLDKDFSPLEVLLDN